MNYLFIDVETTGLSQNTAVIEIAAIPYINGERGEPFHSMVRPHDDATIELKAFEITGINVKEIWEYPEAKEVINEFIKWIDSHETIFNLAGHNIKFDRNNLFRLFCRNGEYGSFISRFNHDDIDTLSLSREIFRGKKDKPVDFKLESLCRHFQIEVGVSHRALQDIENTFRLFVELEKIREKEIDAIEPDLNYHEKMRRYIDMRYIQMNPEGDVFITKDALLNKKATRFILNFLWEKYA
jgi:DNA polymerase III subunit epsilon